MGTLRVLDAGTPRGLSLTGSVLLALGLRPALTERP